MWNPRKVYILVVLLILTSAVLYGAKISIVYTTSTPTVTAGDQVDYTIEISNTSKSWVLVTAVASWLPEGFTYINNSSTGSTSENPSIGGNQLTWSTWWLLWSNQSVMLHFSALASTTAGTFDSYAATAGYRFDQSNAGPTYVTVNGIETSPLLILNKSVNSTTSNPGSQLTYTVDYMNAGDGPAYNVRILENIPATTEYILNSASGAGMNILFSHDGGTSYDANEAYPITDISFELASSLAAGSSGSVTFKVQVK